MALLRESFGKIAQACVDAGVRVGVENREGLVELPLDEEMDNFLQSMGQPEIFGYWHDAGHAQIKEMAGLLEHGPFLRSLRPRQFGFHLHDVSAEEKDHQAPGTGVIDWQMIADQVRPDDIVVMEMSPRLRSVEVRAGRDFLLRTIPLLSA